MSDLTTIENLEKEIIEVDLAMSAVHIEYDKLTNFYNRKLES